MCLPVALLQEEACIDLKCTRDSLDNFFLVEGGEEGGGGLC